MISAICLNLIMSTDMLHLPVWIVHTVPKGSESDSNMALSECIYCLPGYLKIFWGLYIKYKKNLSL